MDRDLRSWLLDYLKWHARDYGWCWYVSKAARIQFIDQKTYRLLLVALVVPLSYSFEIVFPFPTTSVEPTMGRVFGN